MRLHQQTFLLGAAVFAAIIARLFWHVPNMVPTLAVALVLFRQLSFSKAMLSLVFLQVFSDVLLSPQTGFAAFGTWSWFTYSGYIGLMAFALLSGQRWRASQTLLFAAPMSVAYWAWTNFGTWLLSGMYQHTLAGLVQCYALALPFLRNSVVADCTWVAALLLLQHVFAKRGQMVAAAA